MARTPSMTVEQAEAELGRRGSLFITAENRPTIRKWLSANGLPSMFVGGLAMKAMAAAYNDVSGATLERLKKQADEAKAESPEQDETPIAAPVVNGNGHDIVAAIKTIAAQVMPQNTSIDADAVRAIVQEEMAGVTPRQIEVKVGNQDAVKIDGLTHPQFERVLKLVANGANVLLVGPAGCGKTHMAAQIAQALQASYGAIHGSAGASESALTGWLLPSDGGKFEYVPAPFVSLYEKGESLFLFDELDAFDPNMLLVANGALANGHMHIAHRKGNPCVKRGLRSFLMATANTYGTGANPMYAGRSPLDAATLDRFVVVTVDYDKRLEESIGVAGGLSAPEMSELWLLRNKVREAQLRRTISTRAFQKAVIMKAAGDDWKTIISTLVEGWTKDEKAKVGL